ncbi:hypothetical protein AAZX31_05G019300 [Glycine max]|uniref:TCP domain-containing protein n=2 Tax=Glycine subgen. Soja TaxID=1462606 RepID=K7KME0_SOYBN|nr:transcription factor TCP5 [Glycine max]XP_006579501.1 transcription factor TCP5 [Glycine max]XP_025984413.1 transcription factor TCP5 [Glycine max]XP_028231294.1 transcription factor TCP5-like [Glycine soja]XP_028231295.1 transcription factor TCP5-like [Glycine soja]XP_040871799.1 transcription factor TCP5 [Glycine max]KAG5056545.1 hypothetical protein JHK86_011541 [Glycine max]KAG5153581.1 hypothetical protein JHK82_011550 [Glycine max]KAH1132383.1 hypothetical protein GYH30_011310 [Gly|eukprot:XP_006579499.1 transcription factor TCP5 [Glycine max]
MMIESSGKVHEAKNQQEGDDDNNIKIEKLLKARPSTSSSSRSWSAFRNPRIVRVSRSLGSKDRHSKVCTIRGLRDRRIRLSVPTAIQLYNLQDKLGFNQPSKVVDWLLEATKSDIDKLPPLQFPHCFAHQFHQQTLLPGTSQFSLGGFYDAANNNSTFIKDGGNQNRLTATKSTRYWDIDSLNNGKELAESVSISQKGQFWIKTNEQENHQGGGIGGSSTTTHNREDNSSVHYKLFPIGTTTNNSYLPGLLNNGMTHNSYHHSEPSRLSLSHFGSHGLFPSHDSHQSSGIGVPFSSSNFSGASSGPQLLFCPTSATPSAFYSVESDPRQSNNNVQIFSSSSQVMKRLPLIQSLHSTNSPISRRLPTSFSSKLLDSDNNDRSQPNKGTSSRS